MRVDGLEGDWNGEASEANTQLVSKCVRLVALTIILLECKPLGLRKPEDTRMTSRAGVGEAIGDIQLESVMVRDVNQVAVEEQRVRS